MSYFCDVHTHLTHEKFQADRHTVIEDSIAAGLGAIVINGLEPKSNREILDLAAQYEQVKPALGIYPIDGIVSMLPDDSPVKRPAFATDPEIDFIAEKAASGKIVAVGECGLDGHWAGEETFSEQERVFERLIDVAVSHDLPLIIHTRKRERRSIEILAHHKVKKVNFHCYGGKSKLALKAAEEHGWHFSIPANSRKSESFTKLLRNLPLESILTETDAPYMGPVRGERNHPRNVIDTIMHLAELRNIEESIAKQTVWNNYIRLFESPVT